MKSSLALGLAAAVCLAVFLGVASVSSADIVKGFSGHWCVDPQTGLSLPFRLFTPQGYDADPDREYPLILFLHGSGESGTDNQDQINGNIDNLIAHAKMSQYAAFILAPQTNSGWMTYGDDLSQASGATMAALELVQEYFRVDPRRLYITGLSMGGGGTWDLIGKRPNYFAAAVPICGYGDPAKAVNMVDQPIWAFHAANDGTVDVEETREMIAAVRAAGGDPLYTEYTTGGHGIWGKVYNTNEMYDWMFSQQLPLVPEPTIFGLGVSGVLMMLRRRSRRRRAQRKGTGTFFGGRASRDRHADRAEKRASPLGRHRLRVEPLEDRRMLTAYVVNSLADTVADDGLTTLREAILAANNNAELWSGSVPAGSATEADAIAFDPALFTDGTNPVPGVVALASEFGALVVSDPAGLDVAGPGADLLSIDAGHGSRVLSVYYGGEARFSNLALVNGAHGTYGGGISNSGTLSIASAKISGNRTTESDYGYGGAIYNSGALSIVGSSIVDNSIANGEYGIGGAIYSYGELAIDNCVVSRNSTGNAYYIAYGGAIYSGGTLSIVNSTVSGNTATGGYYAYGGGIYSDGVLSITGATIISGNSATGTNYYAYGGGVYSAASLTIDGSTVSGNTSKCTTTNVDYDYGAYGGGVHTDGTLAMTDCDVLANVAIGSGNAYGGGVSGTGTLSIASSTISGNSTTAPTYAYGGGIHNAGTLDVSQSTVSANSVKSSSSYRAFGGGICNDGTLSVADSTISDNTLTAATGSSTSPCGGAGICNFGGTTTISHSNLSGNATTGTASHGGGVFVKAGTMTIVESTLSENRATLGGGGYIDAGELILRQSTVAGNTATGAAGLCNYRNLSIVGSTISGNTATGPAGGIASVVRTDPSRLTVVNSTISGNSGTSGSAIHASGSKAAVSIANSTITANVSTTASGALYVSAAIVQLHNTVVAANGDAAAPQVAGALASSSSYNVIGVATGLSGITDGVNGNRIGGAGSPIDPLLGPLADNGGPTLTHAPLDGSPLVDAGTDGRALDEQGTPLAADQRGFARRFGPVDVGAVESQPPGVPLAYADGFVTDQGAAVGLDVLANDFCTDGSLDVQLVEGPSRGILERNADGTLTYTPEPAFWGVDSFSYRAVNGPFVSNEVAVVVSVTSPESILVTTADDEADGDLTDGDVSLREALQIAAPGSVIQFSAALMDQTIRLSHPDGGLMVADVQIVGLGAEHLAIDGFGRCRVIEAAGTSIVSHVTITGGANSGVYAGDDARLTVADCIISGNTSFGGSGIYNNGGVVDVADCRITANVVNNYAFVGGGGILNRGTMTVARTIISRNAARTSTTGAYAWNRGGGILNEGTLTLVDSVVSGNEAGYTGGGIANYGGTLTVRGCQITENSADYYGGGLDNNSARGAAVSESSFSRNKATSGGGAIAVTSGPVSLTRSVLAGNRATATTANGGGVYCPSGALTVVDSALSANVASQNGGAIYASSTQAAVVLRNTTVTGNTAARGGGVANVTQATIVNSIVALNQATSDPDFYGTLGASSGFNLIGVDPLFVRNPTAADEQGDLRLRGGSPAINRGSNALALDAAGSPLTVDLAGGPRTIYGTVDMGAHEYCMVADVDYSGVVDAADSRILAAHWGMAAMGPDDGDLNGDGRVNAADAAILAANWGATFTPPSEGAPSGPSAPAGPAALAVSPRIGPVPAASSTAGRRAVGSRDARSLPVGQAVPDVVSETVAAASSVRQSLTYSATASDVAAHDAALTEEYGPLSQTNPAAQRLAWSFSLARRSRRAK